MSFMYEANATSHGKESTKLPGPRANNPVYVLANTIENKEYSPCENPHQMFPILSLKEIHTHTEPLTPP